MSLDFSLYLEVDAGGENGPERSKFFSHNITHNLGAMAKAANIYHVLWRPEENDIEFGFQAVRDLEEGLKDLLLRPQHFKTFDATNGWGLYVHFVPFVSACLEACKRYPKARIHACR
jgi:hypothetical protein